MKDLQKIKEFFSKPLEEDFGDALFNTLKPKDENLKAIVDILKQDQKIANAPDQASFKEALERYIRFNGDRGPIGQAAVRALNYRNTGDRYGNGFDRIFDMLVNKTESTNEGKKETGIDMAKKKLDALGVKYEMSKTDKVNPFKVIYKPINKSDEFYDKFEDIIDLFNLGNAVKSSMSEATKDEETKFHTKLDKLVHDTFGKRKGEMEEGMGNEGREQGLEETLVKKVMERLRKS